MFIFLLGVGTRLVGIADEPELETMIKGGMRDKEANQNLFICFMMLNGDPTGGCGLGSDPNT